MRTLRECLKTLDRRHIDRSKLSNQTRVRVWGERDEGGTLVEMKQDFALFFCRRPIIFS